MNNKSPSIQEWRELYEAAIEFKKIECWNWMWDSDIFGVQNPVNGEIGYCCVMGRAREHFALTVYLGTEGLEGYLKTQSGKINPYSMDALYVQKCLIVSFEDRESLQKEDFQVIKRLGLKFRGPNSWPLFRSYRPGYFPWYLTSEEVKYLTIALHQTIDVSLRFKNNPKMFIPPVKNRYLVRVSRKEKNTLEWRDQWLEPSLLEETETIMKPVDVNRLEKIKRMIPQHQGIWEIDFSYFPRAVREKKGRPYYPYVIFCVEHYSYFILDSHLVKPAELISDFREQFLKLVESIKLLPQEILVKRKKAFELLRPITSRLGIKLRSVKKLIALEHAQTSMFKLITEREI